ncbi:MAG: VanZ family protein [Actinomycetota bacterium]
MLTGGLRISGPLIAVWLFPAAVVLVSLIATRRVPPMTERKVMSLVRFALLGYVIAALILAWWPLEFVLEASQVEDGNWAPFGGSLGFLISSNELQQELGGRDVIANIVLFAPIGALMPFAVYQWRGLVVSLLILATLAFGVEVTQGFFIADRTFDIDDAISGFVGGAAGTLFAALAHPLARPSSG